MVNVCTTIVSHPLSTLQTTLHTPSTPLHTPLHTSLQQHSNLELAVRYCCAVQLQLLDLPWPSTVLEWPECIPQYSTNGRLLFRGLRLRMGLTWGRADSRKPLNTGVRGCCAVWLCCVVWCVWRCCV